MSNYLSDLITRITTFIIILICFSITLWQANYLAAFFLGLTTLMLAAGCLRDILNWRLHQKKPAKGEGLPSPSQATRTKRVKTNYGIWRRFKRPRPKPYLR